MIELKNIVKSFGKNLVFSDTNISVQENECCCLIGKNGSGKSTLINIIINLVKPDSGNIKLFGTTYQHDAEYIKKNFGVLPEINPLVDEFSLQDYLEYVGLIYGLEKEIIERRIEYLTNYFFEEKPASKKTIGQFSKGMRLKSGICAALIHKPKLLILDEPFDGLDVFSSKNLVAFLNDYRSRGNSVLVSSHNMLYMDKIATHVSLIKHEKILHFKKEELHTNGKNFEDKVSDILEYNPKKLGEF